MVRPAAMKGLAICPEAIKRVALLSQIPGYLCYLALRFRVSGPAVGLVGRAAKQGQVTRR